jgi:hypothetical protein
LTGEVIEMNWRSVRVRTRARDLVIIPNSVIGKETLVNMSRPTKAHAESHVLGFSYDNAPNKVKRVLMGVVRSTRCWPNHRGDRRQLRRLRDRGIALLHRRLRPGARETTSS